MVGRLITRGAIAGIAILAAELAYAVLRPSPKLGDYDPSGTFGDDGSRPLRVAVLGDSTVTGPGVGSADNTWVRLICRRFAEVGFRVELHSFAVSGSRTRDVIENQLQPALEWHPDLILVWVGANDLLKGHNVGQFREDLDELVGQLSRSEAIVVQSGLGDLGTIPRLKPPLRTIISRRSVMFDDVHHEIAARYGTNVVRQRADSRKVWLEDKELWAEDYFHMSAKGHARAADIMWISIEPLLANLDAAV